MATLKDAIATSEPNAKRLSARDFAELGGRRLVYIRSVAARDVIDDLRDEDGHLSIDVAADEILYSVHSSTGERIALVGSRDLAFAAARQYEMNPVSVH